MNTTVRSLMRLQSIEAYGTSEGVKKEWDSRGRKGVFQKGPDVHHLIGRQFTDRSGQKYQMTGHNDLNVPYFSKVKNGQVGKKQYTHSEGEAAVRGWLKEPKFGEGGKSRPAWGYGGDDGGEKEGTKESNKPDYKKFREDFAKKNPSMPYH